MNTETKVYIINADDENIDFYKATDIEIIEHCETTGNVYSLPGFEEQINNEELELCNSFIRIITVPEPKPKIIIKVQGGMVEETISTTKDLVINIADYDGIRASEKDDLFTHWNCEADRIVSDEEFKKLADDMDHNFKVSFK